MCTFAFISHQILGIAFVKVVGQMVPHLHACHLFSPYLLVQHPCALVRYIFEVINLLSLVLVCSIIALFSHH